MEVFMDQKEAERRIKAGRAFVRTNFDDDTWVSDQNLKKPQPPLVKAPLRETSIALPLDFDRLDIDNDFLHVINSRKSHRVSTEEMMDI